MFSVIPPVGVPFGWRAVFPKADHTGRFASVLGEQLGGGCILTSSGKAALWLALSAMHAERPDRDEIILPDYTCWTVPSATVRAGLKVKPVDLESVTLGLDPEKVRPAITDRTLAVIAPHLFGVPSRIDEIESICREKDVFLIDDAAQAYGAILHGRPIGGFGDSGVLSFGRGKNITTGNGGAVIFRNAAIHRQAEHIAQRDLSDQHGSLADKFQMAVYKCFFSRGLFWIPASMPFLKLGETVYDLSFDLSRMSPDRAGRGLLMLETYGRVLFHRQEVAAAYRERLAAIRALNILTLQPNTAGADLRFPVILADKQKRPSILSQGRKLGISGMYPDTISSVGELRPHLIPGDPCPISRLVADQLVTLPTHQGISLVDVDTICRFLMSATK